LDDRQIFERALDPEIAASDHEAVAGFHDALQVGDRLLILDLGDDVGRGAKVVQDGAELLDVGRFADEAERDEVHGALGRDL
jgi:hypothetical protein